MKSLTCCNLLMSIFLVLILVHWSDGARDKCVFGCVKGAIKCRRNLNIPGRLPPGTDCCAQYSACFLTCRPDSVPPRCTNKGKRGSWNKRVAPPLFSTGLQLPSEYQAPAQGYANEPLGYPFDQWGDLE